jgi:hypothetical protein
MSVAFFGCLRASELTVPNGTSYNSAVHVSNSDVSISAVATGNADQLCVHVKRSKTDHFNKGFNVYIGCARHDVCGLCAVVAYLDWKRSVGQMAPDAPFFSMDGAALSKSMFVQNTRMYLALLGLDSGRFSGHSFRSGGATSAAQAGLADWEIKLLGRWTSDAYQRYIRAPPAMLRSFAQRMCSTPSHQFRAPYINLF